MWWFIFFSHSLLLYKRRRPYDHLLQFSFSHKVFCNYINTHDMIHQISVCILSIHKRKLFIKKISRRRWEQKCFEENKKKQNVSINNLIKRCRFVWLKLKHQKEAAKEIVHKIFLHTSIHSNIDSIKLQQVIIFFARLCGDAQYISKDPIHRDDLNLC